MGSFLPPTWGVAFARAHACVRLHWRACLGACVCLCSSEILCRAPTGSMGHRGVGEGWFGTPQEPPILHRRLGRKAGAAVACSSQQRVGLAIIVQDVAFSCRGEISHVAFLNFGVKSRRQLGKRGRAERGGEGGEHAHAPYVHPGMHAHPWVHSHACMQSLAHTSVCKPTRVNACVQSHARRRAHPCVPVPFLPPTLPPPPPSGC